MAEDEEVGARSDDQEKPVQPTKKHRAKSRSAGPRPDSESEPGGEPGDASDASLEEEPLTPMTDTTSSEAKAAGEEPPESKPKSPEAPAESKPKSLIHLLRFERRAGKPRR